MHAILAFLLLYALGVVGWGLFSLIRAPVPPLLGALVVIGALRVFEVPVPASPQLLDPVVQIALGLFIGSKVTRETVADLGNLVRPALLVAAWALALVFVFGPVLGRVSSLDPVTAVLSSSVGGLPEMMVLAMATPADIASVAVIKLVRAVIIIAIFPLLFYRLVDPKRADGRNASGRARVTADRYQDEVEIEPPGSRSTDAPPVAVTPAGAGLRGRLERLLLTLAVAVAGAVLFERLGVPAGLMVGSIVAVAVASVGGLPIHGFHPKLFNPLLVALGIMVSQHFGPETGALLASGALLWPLFLSTVVVFLTALVVALLIRRLAGWDMPMSLLAAAPGGFTVMTAIAVYYGYDPFRISMVHLARLLAIKTVVPIVFAFLLG
ncbi:MAG: hypothetical protein EA404_10940 [Spirochaetaceae bacterium]|nr:MAG: hypothetical protein EA404_10940 [Spirochaetaceae bacterium]